MNLHPHHVECKLSDEEVKLQEEMDQFGIPNYNEHDFYKTFKISRIDFINKIKTMDKEQQQAEVLKLYDEQSLKGRGIVLKDIEKQIKKYLVNRTNKKTNNVFGI